MLYKNNDCDMKCAGCELENEPEKCLRFMMEDIRDSYRQQEKEMGERKKYNHAEAFCIMKYHCEKCGKEELLWNSRDGVTPFIIGCSDEDCDGHMQHADWHMDRCIPEYKPH